MILPMRRVLLAALCLLPCACSARFGGHPLVSAQSPANANGGANEMPQPVNSLPPGAAGIGSGPNATVPNDASVTLGGSTRR